MIIYLFPSWEKPRPSCYWVAGKWLVCAPDVLPRWRWLPVCNEGNKVQEGSNDKFTFPLQKQSSERPWKLSHCPLKTPYPPLWRSGLEEVFPRSTESTCRQWKPKWRNYSWKTVWMELSLKAAGCVLERQSTVGASAIGDMILVCVCGWL